MNVLFVSSSLTAMHRQSIGSPASKHHHHQQQLLQIDGDVDRKRRPSSAVSGGGGADEEEIKAEKIARSASARAEKILHLIPLLVLFCFFVLYLRSHDPDFPKIVAVGGSFDRIAASTERLFETTSGKIGDALAMNGHRSLHGLGRRNRKVGPA